MSSDVPTVIVQQNLEKISRFAYPRLYIALPGSSLWVRCTVILKNLFWRCFAWCTRKLYSLRRQNNE